MTVKVNGMKDIKKQKYRQETGSIRICTEITKPWYFTHIWKLSRKLWDKLWRL